MQQGVEDAACQLLDGGPLPLVEIAQPRSQPLDLGGLGLVRAKIERRIYAEQFPAEESAAESPAPVPSSAAPLTPAASAGATPSGSPIP